MKFSVGVVFVLLVVLVALVAPLTIQAQSASGCRYLTGGGPSAFCDTFDAPAGTGNRSGQLNGTMWGVSREQGFQSINSDWANRWASGQITLCDGSTPTVFPPDDIQICNGRVHELTNDDNGVTFLAMYPKQPMDFAGRTGTVVFDVTNDSKGIHTYWPEFWMSDKPVPAPSIHGTSMITNPQHGFGVRFAAAVQAGGYGSCPNGNNLDKPRFTIDSAAIVRNYVNQDANVQILDCAIAPTGPNDGLNHFEIHVSQNQIDVYASDAGTTAMHHLGVINNANLSFSRGLVWIEDAHYDAAKDNVSGNHTFGWDNVGFDGPVLPRDLANDVPDQNNHIDSIHVILGWPQQPGQMVTQQVTGVTNIAQATGAILTFNFFHEQAPLTFTYAVNGHTHTAAWPYPDTQTYTNRTIALPVPLSDIVPGTNTVGVTANGMLNVFNIDLILAGAGGIPGGSTLPPTNTPVLATATAVPATPTPVPVQHFSQTVNTGDTDQVTCASGTVAIVTQAQTSIVLTCQ